MFEDFKKKLRKMGLGADEGTDIPAFPTYEEVTPMNNIAKEEPKKPVAAPIVADSSDSDSNIELKVVRPASFEEVSEIADYLIEGCTVVLNLELLDGAQTLRMLDFLNGVTYSNDGEIKKTFYNLSSVPTIFIDGATSANGIITQEDIDAKTSQPSIANIKGSFTTDGNTINIIADFMSYIDLQNVNAFISINEKTTTGNVGSNGETEFHHIMMKMLDDANGKALDIKANEYQRFEFSYDMTQTDMEDINDLEVSLWIQDINSKEIVNSRFAYEYCSHVYPAQNLRLESNNNNLVVSWDAPQNGTPSAYDIYVNNILTAENINGPTHSIAITESGMKSVEVVAKYDDKLSVGIIGMIDFVVGTEENEIENISIYPNPSKDFVKLTAQGSQLTAVKVYNCLGMMVEEIEVNANEAEINISEYNTGIYFFNVMTESGNVIKKIVKK